MVAPGSSLESAAFLEVAELGGGRGGGRPIAGGRVAPDGELLQVPWPPVPRALDPNSGA